MYRLKYDVFDEICDLIAKQNGIMAKNEYHDKLDTSINITH